jgi:glycosyltransferase involved in cell wall biosynthesis
MRRGALEKAGWQSPLNMLAILTTHPIQYQVPIWQALAKNGRVPFEIWYLTNFGIQPSFDQEFGKTFSWNIDLLSSYPHRFVKTAAGASPITFWKCRLREPLRERLYQSGARALWIQGWQVAAYWQAVREAKASGIEVWLRGESNDLASTPIWKRPLKRLALGQLFTRVDRFLYIGTANKRLYQSFGVPQSRLYSAPYAVDNERFAKQAEALRSQRLELRRRWGIADGAFCALFCGKFIPKKRPMDLVEAVRTLRTDGRLTNIHLLFTGSGECGGSLRQACNVVFDAERPSLPASVSPVSPSASTSAPPPASFVGFLNQTEISRAYVAADCLVLPSDHGETWGMVVNEALASGLPCLVSDACGCAEDLVGDDFSFPMGNFGALGAKIDRCRRESPDRSLRRLPSIEDSIVEISKAYSEIGK